MFRNVSNNIAVHEFDIPMMPGVKLPGRATAIRGSDGQIALISPGPMDAAVLDSLRAFGDVNDLIAPNMFHHLYFGQAAVQLAGVRRIAPKGLATKRPDLKFDVFLDTHPTLAGGLIAISADGSPGAEEWLFYSAAERTLIVTDFMMNVHAARGALTPLVMRLTNGWKRSAQTRIWRSTIKDREAARRTARVLFELDIERIVVAHGDIIENNGAAVLRDVLSWLGVD
jgi:hypothetical protein